MDLILETERLCLRPFTMDDAEAMFTRWASDDEVTKYLTWPSHESIETTRMIIARWLKEYEQPERLNFAIVLKGEDRPIGGIDVLGCVEGAPVIGYNLARAYWGRGIMTEACRRVIAHLFSIGYDAVRIDAMVENIGSNRVIRKCGGELVKTEEDYQPLKDRTVMLNRYIVKKR